METSGRLRLLLTLKLTTCTDKTFPNINTSLVDVAIIQTFSDFKLHIIRWGWEQQDWKEWDEWDGWDVNPRGQTSKCLPFNFLANNGEQAPTTWWSSLLTTSMMLVKFKIKFLFPHLQVCPAITELSVRIGWVAVVSAVIVLHIQETWTLQVFDNIILLISDKFAWSDLMMFLESYIQRIDLTIFKEYVVISLNILVSWERVQWDHTLSLHHAWNPDLPMYQPGCSVYNLIMLKRLQIESSIVIFTN